MLSTMVGAVVTRVIASTNSTSVLDSDEPSLEEKKLVVAASVTVLSGIIQVSTFSRNLPAAIRLF